jgi:hypothetical protein
MSRNAYQVITRWCVESTVEEISEMIGNAPDGVLDWKIHSIDLI